MESEVDDGGTWPDGPSMNEDNTWNNDPTNVQNDNDNTIWTPLESLNSPDCLLTIKNGDLTWKSTPSVQNVEQIGEWGNEKISVKLKVDPGTVSPLMLKYLKLEFHLYEGGLSDTRIAEALVYFGQMQHITAVDLSLADTRAALKTHNDQAVAQRGMIKVSFATSQATMNMSTQQLSSLQRFDMAMKMKSPEIAAVGSRYDELTAIKAILESQGIINIDLLLNKPSIRSGEDFTEVLQHAFSQSFEADKSENPMDVWFPKSERSHDMPLGHVPKLDGTLPLGLPKQDPIVRFQHEDQYMVTQIVGSVNQAYAEQAAAQDVVSTEFAAHVVPLKSANDNSQFIVIVKPKGHDIYLPTYGESCFLQLTGAKRKRPVVLPDTAKVAESILLPIQDHQDNTDEHFIAIIREDLLKIMDSDYDDETILSLRAADDEEPEFHAVRIEAFVRDNVNSLVPKATETIIEDETIWFPATRMDFKFPKVPADAQTYLASCPLEARDNEAADPGARKPISVELPFVELDMTVSIDDYMESVLADEKQRNLKAFVQRTTSDKTIRAEVFAINALHNPESAKNSVAIGARNVEAFKYIQGFQRDDSMRSVNLHEKFPVLEELSQRNHRPSSSTCPEQIKAHYEKLDEAKQRVISNLDSLPAGFAFVPGVAGSGKTELIKFIVAACTFGQGTAEPVPALYLAPNNQAVDDMANKFQGYFEKLGLDGAPSIIRLYGLDFETKSVTRVLAPGPSTAYQYFDEDKAQGVIQEMDSEAHGQDPTDQAYQFLAVYQFERMGVDMNNEQKKSRSKRIRSTNVSADTAAVAYYQAHADKYPDLSAILEISNRDRNLSNDNLKDLRRLVKIIFHDMLFDFKGIICTTPVVAANATVKRFQAELVFTDEAARQSELSSLISVAHYNPFAWFYLGDPEQLKPYVGQAAKTTDNPFIRQMSVSLLERAVLAGVELGWLEFTHRLGGSLRSLPSRINYGKRMKSGLGTLNWPPSTRAFANEMTQLLGDTHQKELSRVVVQFPFSMSTLAGTSSKNITHVRWVISQVKKMLRNPELQTVDSTEKARFLILPMYRAQVDLYRKMLLDEWTQRNISVEDYQRIEVRTLDSAQGEERDLVIVDYVQTHKAGFCVDSSRNCLATTRAKQCEILIINAGMINHPRVEESKVGQILEHATRFGYVLEVSSCTNCDDPSHTDDNCTTAEKTCHWCKEAGHSRVTCPKVRCSNCRLLGHVQPICEKPRLCQQCGEENGVDHNKTCLGKKICSVCWECHTGEPCNVCAHCRETGHKASDCFKNPGSKKVAKDQTLKCRCCGELGHKAGNCPNKRARTCHSCGSEDHLNKDCTTPLCKNCKQLGHRKNECPSLVCKHCGQLGHIITHCTNAAVFCKTCRKSGHVEENCKAGAVSSTQNTQPRSYLPPPGIFKGMKSSGPVKSVNNALGISEAMANVPSISFPAETSNSNLPDSGDQGGEGTSGDGWVGETGEVAGTWDDGRAGEGSGDGGGSAGNW